MIGQTQFAHCAPIERVNDMRRQGGLKARGELYRCRIAAKAVTGLQKKNTGFAAREIGRGRQRSDPPADDDRVVAVGSRAADHRRRPAAISAITACAARSPETPSRCGDAAEEGPPK